MTGRSATSLLTAALVFFFQLAGLVAVAADANLAGADKPESMMRRGLQSSDYPSYYSSYPSYNLSGNYTDILPME